MEKNRNTDLIGQGDLFAFVSRPRQNYFLIELLGNNLNQLHDNELLKAGNLKSDHYF